MKALVLALVAAAAVATAAEIAPEDRRSGSEFAAPETRAMQDDDNANPGILGVLQGEALWTTKVGAADRSCADCHGDAPSSMKGVAARYPAYDPALASLSIGIVSHAWAIREAIAEHFDTYDLLRGAEPYKYDLGGKDRWLGRLEATLP